MQLLFNKFTYGNLVTPELDKALTVICASVCLRKHRLRTREREMHNIVKRDRKRTCQENEKACIFNPKV